MSQNMKNDEPYTVEQILSADKARTEGIEALSPLERDHYRLYLCRNVNKVNSKGIITKPIHANIVDLVLLETKVIIVNQTVYHYNKSEGRYVPDSNGLLTMAKIKNFLEPEFIEDRIINGIYNLLLKEKSLVIDDTQLNNRPKHWIHFLNGYYDYMTDELYPHNPKYYEIGVIGYNYNPSSYPGNYKFVKQGKGMLRESVEKELLFDTWFEEAIPDYNDRRMFLQYLGYALTLDTSKQKFMFICGSGGTGKSTLLNLVEAIIGKENVASVSLQGLQERFSPGALYLKQANICADIPLTALSEVDMIKKLTGEDTISAERKFKDQFFFKSYARLFFSGNDIPVNLSDKTNAFYRRMLVLKMDHKPEQIDYKLGEKLKEEIPNIITKIMEELFCSGGEIDESDCSKNMVRQAHKNSDTVEAFIQDKCETDTKARVDRADLYDAYNRYCFYEDRKAVSRSNFNRALQLKGFEFRRGNKGYNVVGLKLSNIVLSQPGTEKGVC